MKRTIIKLGYLPTRRNNFPKEYAQEYRDRVKLVISGYPGVEVVDIEDVNDDGILDSFADVEKIVRKFRNAEIDAIFIPHCNFGSEVLVTDVAAALRVPTLLWGPRDDAPDSDGMRFRDSQCGLFATSKVMRRHNVPFTYINNVCLDSPVFAQGFDRFLRVAEVAKTARNIRILQIGTRPTSFYTVIINESELMEKFGAQVIPMALPDVTKYVLEIVDSNEDEFQLLCAYIKEHYYGPAITDERCLKMFAGLKIAIQRLAAEYRCNAVALQCWNALQDLIGVVPCFANSLLADCGLPVACETDIHGAISAVLLQAASGNTQPHFFADITIRHPTDDNTELLWHCGPFPHSLAKDQGKGFVRGRWHIDPSIMGNCFWELKNGDITLCRFDGDNGKYSLLMGEGKGIDGPKSAGSYVWFKTDNWPAWERKLIYGPYIHHVAGAYGKYADVLYEACRYIPALVPDPVEPSADELEAVWMG